MKHMLSTVKNYASTKRLKTNKRVLRYRLKGINEEIDALKASLLQLRQGLVYNQIEQKLKKKIEQRKRFLYALEN